LLTVVSRRMKIYKMAICALFTVLTAVLSQIAIPIGPVPINLATFAVFCAGALLGSKLGVLSLTVFVALGAFGMPVFAMFRGGIGTLAGPTGGYIVGYIPAAFLIGLIIEKWGRNNKIFSHPVAMLAGMLACFTLGTAWFMFSTNTELWASLTICVLPFLPGEFIKIAAATIVAKRLRPALQISSNHAASFPQ
jgi:biotin transport system substrate-specific component